MLATPLVHFDTFANPASDSNHTKFAMLSASSPVFSQQVLLKRSSAPSTPLFKAMEPTMLDRELLQHYAYLRYGDGSGNNKDKSASGRKQHVCPVRSCGRRFSTPGNLSRHKRLHGPIKPLKCPVEGCICAFRSENKLEKHMKFHLGIPVHVCPVPACGKTFSTAGNLNRHIKGHHPHVDVSDLKSCSTSSSCDEYESSVGGDEVVRERIEEAAEEDEELVRAETAADAILDAHPHQPQPQTNSATTPADQLDALVAMLDQDMSHSETIDTTHPTSPESMLELLLFGKPERKHSLLDDMIRFHIDQIEEESSSSSTMPSSI